MTQEEFELHRAAEIAKLKVWENARTGQVAVAEVERKRIAVVWRVRIMELV